MRAGLWCKGRGVLAGYHPPLTIVGDDDFWSVEKERTRGKALRKVVRGVIRGNGAGRTGGWGRRRVLADTAAAREEGLQWMRGHD